MTIFFSFFAVDNPCEERNCSFLCLISAMSINGSSCSCANGFIMDSNEMECNGM